MSNINTINFGIDLGTTNSAIAVFENGDITIFKNPRTLKQTIPSVVAFKGDRTIVGEKAAELFQIGSADVFGAFKRRMGSMERFYVEPLKREVSPIELSSIVLKELKTFIQSNELPDAVVITIPASFDTNQSNATKEAGYAAGFKEVVLLQEPIAASLAYANKKKTSIGEGKWIVFDFGGGTFDVALIGIMDDEMQIIDHEGDNFLGGKDIDTAIVERFIIPALEEQGNFTSLLSQMRRQDGAYHQLYNKLIYLAEEAKIALSSMDKTDIEFDTTDEKGKHIEMFLSFSQSKLEEIAQPFIKRSIDLVETLFRRNEVSGNDINYILLVGGTTYIPAVRKALAGAFGVEIKTDIDPTTAVVVGAAYFAALRVKMAAREKPEEQRSKSDTGIGVQTAYERLVRSDETALLVKIDDNVTKHTLRVFRLDGGYDSGTIHINKNAILQLPLMKNGYNEFDLSISDHSGKTVYNEKLGISQGSFGIQGQPLPHPIGIEVDDPETNSTYLEIIFKKNAILPLRRTFVKRVSETIKQGTDKAIRINVYEGEIDSIPQANKLIGTIEISGHDLIRDLIKGSDIELTIEISESRDVKVAAYLVLSDQAFANTFSPSEIQFNASMIRETIRYFKENLLARRDNSEKKGKYEEAGQIQSLLNEIEEFKTRLSTLEDNDSTDEKYIMEVKSREIGKRIHEIFNSSYLTKVIEEYYQMKRYYTLAMLENGVDESEKMAYREIVSHEREFLQEGNITVIKMKTAQVDAMVRRIRSKKPITVDELKMLYIHYKGMPYKDQAKAADLIDTGDDALRREDMIKLNMVIMDLYRLSEQEAKAEDYFINRKTGLE